MTRKPVSQFVPAFRVAALGVLIVVALGVSPAAAQFVCGAAGTYPVVGGNVTVPGGGTATGSTGNTACGGDASGTGSANNTAIGRLSDAHGNTESENVATGVSSNASGQFGFNTATGASANASSSTAFNSFSANVATGAAASAFGDGSRNVAIGSANPLSGLTSGMPNASGNGSNNIAIGSNAIASGDNSNNIAIGINTTASGNSVAIGSTAQATNLDTIAVGRNSDASGIGAIAIGSANSAARARAGGDDAVAIGTNSSANFNNSVAIGNGATVTRANQQVFGTASNTYTMAGIASAASTAAQSGPTQLVTSDNAGNLATTTLAALGLASTGDIAAINSQLANINGRLDDLTARSNRAYTGVAMAFAMAGVPTLLPHEKLAMTMNYGTFEGSNGLAINAAFRLGDNMQLTSGIGYGPNERIAGGRVGLRVGW